MKHKILIIESEMPNMLNLDHLPTPTEIIEVISEPTDITPKISEDSIIIKNTRKSIYQKPETRRERRARERKNKSK